MAHPAGPIGIAAHGQRPRRRHITVILAIDLIHRNRLDAGELGAQPNGHIAQAFPPAPLQRYSPPLQGGYRHRYAMAAQNLIAEARAVLQKRTVIGRAEPVVDQLFDPVAGSPGGNSLLKPFAPLRSHPRPNEKSQALVG